VISRCYIHSYKAAIIVFDVIRGLGGMEMSIETLQADPTAYEDMRMKAASWFDPAWVQDGVYAAACVLCHDASSSGRRHFGTLNCLAQATKNSGLFRTRMARDRFRRLKPRGSGDRPCAGPCCCVCERCLLRVVAYTQVMNAEMNAEPRDEDYGCAQMDWELFDERAHVTSPTASPKRTPTHSPSRTLRRKSERCLGTAITEYLRKLGESYSGEVAVQAYAHISASSGYSYFLLPMVSASGTLDPLVHCNEAVQNEEGITWIHQNSLAVVVSRPVTKGDGEIEYASICSSLALEDAYLLVVMEQWIQGVDGHYDSSTELWENQFEVSLCCLF